MRLVRASALLLLIVACSRAAQPTEADADPQAARERRTELVQSIETKGWLKSERVRAAMLKVPRHRFVPEASLVDAYRDAPFPIGHDQTISQPSIVATMTEALDLHGTERVLEIGTGSGYQAAVISLLAREVYSIELVEPLGLQAKQRLRDLGYTNVEVRIGDGYAGWPEKAPFDRVIVTAAPPELPPALTDQLAEGGILVAPIGDSPWDQTLVRVTKRDGKLLREELEAVHFVPMVKGAPR